MEMRYFRCSPDEILITDGKTAVLIMARDGDVEIESTFATYVCCGCSATAFATDIWEYCEDCPKEIEPR